MPNMKCQIRSWFSTQRKKLNLSSWPHRWWVLTICSGNWNSIGWNRHSWNGNLMHQFVKLLKLHLIVCWSWIIATRKRGLELEYFWLKTFWSNTQCKELSTVLLMQRIWDECPITEIEMRSTATTNTIAEAEAKTEETPALSWTILQAFLARTTWERLSAKTCMKNKSIAFTHLWVFKEKKALTPLRL